MGGERKLTEEDREKIQRLLESGTLENINLALSLIEETAGQEDIADIFTMNVIVELICINGPESLDAMVRAGQFIRRCPETWKRFSEAVVGPDQNGVGPHVLTSQRYVVMVSKIDLVTELWPSKSVSINHLLDGFTLISSGAAEQLLRDEDEVWYEDLSLGGLTFISDVVAKILSKHKEGDLCLDGLTDLSGSAAESLGKHNGDLHLNGLKSIPSEKGHTALLNKLCQQEEIRLNGLSELSDAVAESLSKHKGRLYLEGLTELSDTVAVQLASHNNLHTSTKIKRQIKKAVSIRNQQARKSERTGETALTKKQAIKLRKLFRSKDADNVLIAVELIDASEATQDDISDLLSSSVLSLLVNTWDVRVWNALAPLLISYPNAKREFTELANKRVQHQSSYGFIAGFYGEATKPLALLGLKIIDDTSGWLVDLTCLSDAAAESLSKHKGRLYLSGLTSLSDAAAESLSKHEGTLDLRGLTSLSDGPGHIALAESLSKREEYLNLYGLTELSDAAAQSLSKHEGDLGLGGLTELSDGPGHIALAESLSKHKGRLDLRGLTSLSDTAAESLSKHEGHLNLWGLTSLSDAAAKGLSKHKGTMDLSGLTTLSVVAAKQLAKHDGGIDLDDLPGSAAKILRDAGHGE